MVFVGTFLRKDARNSSAGAYLQAAPHDARTVPWRGLDAAACGSSPLVIDVEPGIDPAAMKKARSRDLAF